MNKKLIIKQTNLRSLLAMARGETPLSDKYSLSDTPCANKCFSQHNAPTLRYKSSGRCVRCVATANSKHREKQRKERFGIDTSGKELDARRRVEILTEKQRLNERWYDY